MREPGRRELRGWGAGVLAGLIALLLGLTNSCAAQAAPKFPPLTGRVVDAANVLPPETEQQLTDKLARLQQQTSRQLVVATIPDLQGYEIADYGYQLGRAWGIGQKGTNNGVLFIIAPSERKTRIEVGYGLEPIITDALSSVILNRVVLPKFKAGDMPGGIVAGTDALIQQLSLDPSAAEQKAAEAAQSVRGGEPASSDGGGLSLGTIVTLLIILFVLASVFRRRRRRGYGGGGFPLWPLIFMGGGGRSSGGWSSGGGSSWGGGDGGGGFSGGGGSFGGGGASGSW